MDTPSHAAHLALERMIQRALRCTRFTQDSPVMLDVWIAYGLRGGPLDLLLTPHWQSGSVALASALHAQLGAGPRRSDGADPARAAAIAVTQSTIAASLTLEELVRAALPLSGWWHEYLVEPASGRPPGDLLALWRDPAVQPTLRAALLARDPRAPGRGPRRRPLHGRLYVPRGRRPPRPCGRSRRRRAPRRAARVRPVGRAPARTGRDLPAPRPRGPGGADRSGRRDAVTDQPRRACPRLLRGERIPASFGRGRRLRTGGRR